MTYSEIKLTFIDDLPLGAQVGISTETVGSDIINLMTETWAMLRNAPFKVTKGASTEVPGERSAINFVAAFQLDYNSLSQYEISRTLNEVTIKSVVFGEDFTGHFVRLAGEDLPDMIEWDVINFTGETYKVNSLEISEADTTPCAKVKVTIETSLETVSISSPIVEDVEDTEIVFEWFRGQTINVTLNGPDDGIITFPLTLPKILAPGNFELSVNSTPTGGNIQITPSNIDGLDIEYSLDGEEWQTEPTFEGLVSGNYTLYVRDQLGCAFEKLFEINEFGIYTPILSISKENSIRFAGPRVDFDVFPKTEENALGCEENVEVAYCGCQNYLPGDVITTQVKSNYGSLSANLVSPSGTNLATLSVIKKSTNIGNKDKRAAIKFKYAAGKVGIYFQTGNIYNFDSGSVIGTHYLNGSLPFYATVGNYVIIDGLWYEIEKTVFDEFRNAEVIVISMGYIGPEVAITVGSIFNYENYEVYEFVTSFNAYNGQKVQVKVTATDSVFETATFLSEPLHIYDDHEDLVELRYRNEDNTDIFYQTGIEHLMRPVLTRKDAISDETSSINKADQSVTQLSSTIYEGHEFTFEPVTQQIMRKLIIALSAGRVLIDGQRYVKSGDVEVEGALDKSNLYVVKAKMLKAGDTDYNHTAGDLFNGDAIEMPGLVDYGGGFVKL